MSLLQELKARKEELQKKLLPYEEYKRELENVERALKAVDPDEPKCDGFCRGCDICRRGMDYR